MVVNYQTIGLSRLCRTARFAIRSRASIVGRMAICQRPTSIAHRLLVTRLESVAQRYSSWTEPDEQTRTAAVDELREIGGDNWDAFAEAAGIMLGCHPPGDPSHDWYRIAASYSLQAAGLTEADERVGEWIRIGGERRTRTRAAHAAGDTYQRSFGQREE